MGIAFIAAKGKQFQHRSDRAFDEEFASGNLFSRLPDTITSEYRCAPFGGKMPEIGTQLVIYLAKEDIKAFHLNKPVGVVMSPDCEQLSQIMKETNVNLLPAEVVEIQALSNVFLVRLGLKG